MKVKGIARFVHLMKPSLATTAPQGQEKSYSIEVLIHKDDPQCKEVQKEIDDAVSKVYPNGAPSGFKSCFKDSVDEHPEFKDYMRLTFKTKESFSQPPIWDPERKPYMGLESEIEGKYIWVSGSAKAYTTGSVTCFLNGSLLTGEKGPISEDVFYKKQSVTFDSMFGDISENNVPFEPSIVPVPKGPDLNSKPKVKPFPPVPPQEKHVMTERANGLTRDQFISQGWTDEQLISENYMLPPNGVTPSFGQ